MTASIGHGMMDNNHEPIPFTLTNGGTGGRFGDSVIILAGLAALSATICSFV